ncbi:phage-type endonuclease [Clostridioides difficile]|nr:phage-type endonuclease [Clostridioides difficile]VIF38075.1 phage-type endonuclease [Clostridioides difficile]
MNKNSSRRKYLDAFIVTDTKNIDKIDWLKNRQLGIGGSDASAVAGLNPWKTSVQVYIEKKEEIPIETKSFRMELGNRLEGLVAELFTEETGLKVRNVNGMLKNEKYPFAIANIDRAIVGEKAFLECKTTNSFSIKEWENGVPLHYEIQCLHYMAVTGATHCYIAALLGNEKFVWHKINRDNEVIKNLMKIESEFWEENVLKDILPIPDGSDAYSEFLKTRYKNSVKEKIELNLLEDGISKLKRYDDIVLQMKELKGEKQLIEQEIQSEMREFELATLGGRIITWKGATKRSIDTKRLREEMPDIAEKYTNISSYRTFKIK